MMSKKQINEEELNQISGGNSSITEVEKTAVKKMLDEANRMYEEWLTANPNVSSSQCANYYNVCVEMAYQELSANDKKLVDSYRTKL